MQYKSFAGYPIVSCDSAHNMVALSALVIGLLSPTIAIAQDMPDDQVASVDAIQSDEASPFGDNVIIVTARKRSENLQDTPIAISAFSSEEMEVRNATDVTDLSGVAPNLSFESGSSFSGSSATPTLFIRGIGQSDFVLTADPGVGVYVDGIYVARSVGSLFDLVDLERIEVLRGPQGTLFGRNTIGGAISLVSKAPTYEFSGKLDVTVGTDNLIETKGSLNIPLSETLATRISAVYRRQDGYVDALQYDDLQLGREETWGGRIFTRWEPTGTFSIDISADYSKDTSGPSAFYMPASIPDFPIAVGAPFRPVFNEIVSGDPSCTTEAGLRDNPACYGAASIMPGNPYTNNSLYYDIDGNVVEPKNPLEVYGVSGVATLEVGDLTFKSISGWRGFDASFKNDVDYSPHIIFSNIVSQYKQEQFSQELQLIGSLANDAIDFVLGAYYFDEKVNQNNNILSSVAIANNFPSSPWFLADYRQADNKSLAGFGQATAHLFDERLHLTAGIRFTHDEKEYQTRTAPNPTVAPLVLLKGFQEAKEWTPMFNVAFDVSEDIMVYGTFSEGFRDGGFPPRLIGAPTEIGSYDPEFVEVWEVGFKTQLFDRVLTLNGAYFNTSYSDIQVAAIRTDLPVGSGSLALSNLAAATIQGVELEALLRIGDNWRIDYSFGYLENEIDEIVGDVLQSGSFQVTKENSLPYMPDITSNLGISYYLPFPGGDDVLFRLDWKHIGGQFLGIENIPEQYQEAYNVVNAAVSYTFPDDRFQLTLGVKNLTKEEYATTSVITNDLAGGITRNINRPRYWFLSGSVEF